MKFSTRADKIEPFYVMEVAKAAQQLAKEVANGPEPMIFLNIGEPDFTAPAQVQQAASVCIAQGSTQYTNALGLEALREAISAWYQSRFGVDVPAQRIVITAGASAALQLACLALIEPGDEILMPDPSYPCNRHFVSAAEGTAKLIPTGAAERYQLSAEQVAAHWGEQTRGVLLASPSNPTGTSIDPAELRRIHEVVKAKGGITIVDEIYLGLSYEEAFGHSALAISDDIISINSFSKYFNMTGWRLGYLIGPAEVIEGARKVHDFLTVGAAAPLQEAAVAGLEMPASYYEELQALYTEKRDHFLAGLDRVGLKHNVPQGTYFVMIDISDFLALPQFKGWTDLQFCEWMIREVGVAAVPGSSFFREPVNHLIRMHFARGTDVLDEAVRRLEKLQAFLK